MPTGKPFSTTTTLPALISPAKSVGAHLGAKLSAFQSDERTLTDELCDMLAIWLSKSLPRSPSATWPPFDLTLTKTTPWEERRIGADLELVFQTPLGTKRCLLQAKVVEPNGTDVRNIRSGDRNAWAKLRRQLLDMRAEVGDLAFLLLYLPGDLLDGARYGFGSWEQGYIPPPGGTRESYWGATVIAVDRLLTSNGRWISRTDKLGLGTQAGSAAGMPFWQFLIGILLCGHGKWNARGANLSDEHVAFRRLAVGVSKISEEQWSDLQKRREELLRWQPPNESQSS